MGAFGSCHAFGKRSPDLAWVERSRWDALTPEQQRQFPPLCPDFVLELRSPSDRINPIRAKMQEYLNSGAQLGWLFNPEDKAVEIYQPGRSVNVLSAPQMLSGNPVLPGFSINLSWLWQ